MTHDVDCVKLATSLAINHPDIYIELVINMIGNKNAKVALQIYKDLVDNASFISTIRTIRGHFGVDLKEAKDILENVFAALVKRGDPLPSRFSITPAQLKSQKTIDIFDEIMKYI